MKKNIIPLLRQAICLILLSAVVLPASGSLTSRAADLEQGQAYATAPDLTRTTRLTPDEPFVVYIPILFRGGTQPVVTLTAARTGDLNGNEQTVFLPGDPVRYSASGRNNYPDTVSITLRWEVENPCGVSVAVEETLALPPGDWQHTATGKIADCPGIFTSTARVINVTQMSALAMLDVVNPPSIVETNNQQGFDRCHLPTVPQMQTWWDTSPYWVFNIYLGGNMFYCDDEIPDAFWVHQVAGQGWKFILTWVGPQAPCSVFREKMSLNTSTARQQGRSEASAAAAAATQMGFLGNRVIYYDLEAYGSSASTGCRAAVAAFIRGWTERLHELGYLAGGYGSPVTSHIADWASNSPPPDFIWIAHWLTPAQYRPNATVWSSYLSDSLWNNHQRIRQYAGGHYESWGGVTLDIDSNVLDGAITTIPLSPAPGGINLAPGSQSGAQVSTERSVNNPPGVEAIQRMELLSQTQGWVLQGDRLLISADGGQNWQDITPLNQSGETLLEAEMLDLSRGWVVRQPGGNGALTILHTQDGGTTWQESRLQLPPSAWDGVPVAAAHLDFIDGKNGWMALRLASGSSFSLGRLFATQDGGLSWEERTLPLGEAVRFDDALHGWVAGGPGGDQHYRTTDGGYTWQADTTSGQTIGDQPASFNELPVTQEANRDGTQWIVVQDGRCSGNKNANDLSALRCFQRSSLYSSTDGGITWREITPLLP